MKMKLGAGLKLICFAGGVFILIAGCSNHSRIGRQDILEIVPKLCKEKYQAHVTCRAVANTLWVYLPYTTPRSGTSGTKIEKRDLMLEYRIASFNPYKVIEPPELRFLEQRILGEIRQLQLRCVRPYSFFVLVVSNILPSAPPAPPPEDDWYMGYFNDIKHFFVGRDFSGEGYSRLVWYSEPVTETMTDEAGKQWYRNSRDTKGEHVPYHDVTMEEFVEKQIRWRIYKRFTLEYNTVPFDLTAQEKRDAIIHIVKTVLRAYNFKGFENIYLKDSSFLEEEKKFIGHPREDIEKYPTKGITRKPAF